MCKMSRSDQGQGAKSRGLHPWGETLRTIGPHRAEIAGHHRLEDAHVPGELDLQVRGNQAEGLSDVEEVKVLLSLILT